MALTATEQLQIIDGTVKPPSNSLIVLVHQTASIKAKQTYDGYKIFDETANTLAASYVSKMLNISTSVFRKNGDVIAQLSRIFVTILGDTTFTLAQIQAATDTEWEAFILDQMDEAFEYLAAVRKEEKTAYNAIV